MKNDPMMNDGADPCDNGTHCCCCGAGETCCDCGKVLGPDAGEVLRFLDTFAGQENTAEEVREFVQLAARYVDEDKSEGEWQANDTLASFIEWAKEERAKQ